MKYWSGLGKRTADDVTGFGKDAWGRASGFASSQAKAFQQYITRRAQELMKFAQDTAGQVTGGLGGLGKGGKRGLSDDTPDTPKGYTCMTLPPRAASYAAQQLKGGYAPGPAAGAGMGQQRGLGESVQQGTRQVMQMVDKATKELQNMFARGIQQLQEMYKRMVKPLVEGRKRSMDFDEWI
jgi:hypothetical protein